MGSNLRYSAAKTSTISRNTLFKSPTKKSASPLKNILPSQSKYKQNLTKKAPQDDSDRLPVQDYNVELDYQLSRKDNIITAMDTILENQWSECSSLNKPMVDNEGQSMEQMVFSLPGLSMNAKAEIMKYRMNQIPSGLVTTNQLYSIFEKEGNTFVDRNIELSIRQGQIKKFIITNASPIISNINKNTKGKMTYGYENVEVLTKSDNYFQVINKSIEKYDKHSLQWVSLTKFLNFVMQHTSSLYMTINDGLDHNELSTLVGLGYVTLTSNHLNEIESQQYALSFPNCGTYLKLINAGRSWVVKILSKSKHKEFLETQIFQKWEGSDLNGNNKMTNFRKPFYGFDLHWILADCLGSGILEVFNTPVGRGWKLTGKR